VGAHAVLCALCLGAAVGAMVNPGLVFSPAWMLSAHQEVYAHPRFRLHVDEQDGSQDELAGFLTAFIADVSRVGFPLPATPCEVEPGPL